MDGLVFGWRTALLLVVTGQLLVAAAFLLVRRFDRLANRILATLLFVVALTLTPQMIGFAGFYDAYPWLSFAPLQNDLLVGPLILAYAQALTKGRVPRWVWWLMIPGAADLLYHVYWFLQPVETRWERVGALYAEIYWPVRTLLAIGLTFAGLAWSAVLYRQHRAFVRNYSSAAAEFDPRWLPVFLGIVALILSAWTVLELTNQFITGLDYVESYPFHVLVALSSWAIGQGALVLQGEPFPKIRPQAGATEAGDSRDWTGDATRLRQRVIDEAWHLEPRLSAPDLARRLGTNETYLSRTVNQGAGVNFNRFINEIRVADIKNQLRAGAPDLLASALECGFNSKATFNRVFKEITGETPAAFRAGLRGK